MLYSVSTPKRKKMKKIEKILVGFDQNSPSIKPGFGVNLLYKKQLNRSKNYGKKSVDFCLQWRYVCVNLAPALELVVPVKL
jgi:hypothetical protein